MPDVKDRRLDVALSDIGRAGYDQDDVEVVGGGTFGIVDESNWQVCEQEPAAGGAIGSAPRLTVDRTCDSAEQVEPDQAAEEPSADPADEQPSEEAVVAQPKKAKKPKKAAAAPPVEEAFTMPALVGANLQDAQDALQAVGSYILTQTDATGLERFQMVDSNWKVCAQNPAPGARTPLSTMVDLGAVKLDEVCP